MNYKPLETEFTKNGFRFRQIRREGDIAIFHKLALEGLPRSAPHTSTYDAGFETAVISRHDGYEMAGNKFDPAEMYPSNEQWGTKGWTYHTLYEAELRFDRLLGKIPEAKVVGEEVPAKPRRPRGEPINLTIPVGEFTVGELASKNSVDYSIAFQWNKAAVAANQVQFLREERRNAKGKPSKIFTGTKTS